MHSYAQAFITHTHTLTQTHISKLASIFNACRLKGDRDRTCRSFDDRTLRKQKMLRVLGIFEFASSSVDSSTG